MQGMLGLCLHETQHLCTNGVAKSAHSYDVNILHFVALHLWLG